MMTTETERDYLRRRIDIRLNRLKAERTDLEVQRTDTALIHSINQTIRVMEAIKSVVGDVSISQTMKDLCREEMIYRSASKRTPRRD